MFANVSLLTLKKTAVYIAVVFISFGINISHAACDKTGHPNNLKPANLLQDIKREQYALNAERMALKNSVMFPMLESSTQRQALIFQEEITDKVIFPNSQTRRLNQQFAELSTAIQQDNCHQARQIAQTLITKITTMRANFNASKTLFQAKNATVQGKETLMMYRMMKSVNAPSPIADYAHKLNHQAQAALKQGDLVTALRKYQQAELTFNQYAFKEVVDGFKRNQEIAKEYTAAKLANIRSEVARYLEDHFIPIPAGSFLMGSNQNDSDEAPQHRVTLDAFKLGKTEIPFTLWDFCLEVRMCLHRPSDEHWGRGNHPVINISYSDIVERFIPWLTFITGKQYRLPTEAEWEYAARAGSTSDFAWGNNLDCTQAQFDDGFASTCATQKQKGTLVSQSFKPNAWGLFDMHGNVWEWVDSCYSKNYSQAKKSARQCQVTVLRGGSWKDGKDNLRSSNRFYFIKTARKNNFGFRLVEL
ncbi:formylglycine-generating enzyme family protein [Marinagarivorans cellulosilyticus]|uniref:Sulfatase-modifying factor enzyme-like domain-containing protein n=1 Tax=Marinagarivorans cellulosilyticus TaxID=2721545 RepID=A0AAN1WF10_9GAMM|nr:formylglycine-generating enzyme family protein [Marinagarivorans cellulosilyticus]BCD96386.1 hypothetical protein MARGE09_P0586 [Marinagarivorans cellulosilyticus]